uniref:Putative secreted protein n=1 Tax=Ixodes ricinus TaxID=34613 RepID=A0A6B0ULJ8_IXORI
MLVSTFSRLLISVISASNLSFQARKHSTVTLVPSNFTLSASSSFSFCFRFASSCLSLTSSPCWSSHSEAAETRVKIMAIPKFSSTCSLSTAISSSVSSSSRFSHSSTSITGPSSG